MSVRTRLPLLFALCLWLAGAAPAAHARPDALPPPVVPAPFGVNIHFTGAPARDLNGLQSAGFGWVRMDFGWAGIEKTKGVYDFSAYDALVDGLTARHIRPLFILDYGNDLYQQGSPRSPEARAAFARFAAAAVRHYHGKTILWEIWNEPNIGFWKPRPDADEYGQLAVETARAIKEADPDATVLAPGSSTIPLPFMETIFKKGLLQYVDAVSVHPYRGTEPESAVPEYRALRQLIARYAPAGRDIPLVSSEWGYSTVGVSETTQAQYLARQWLSNLAEGIRLSIWYDWHEDGQSPTDPEAHFGTVRWDYRPKPAYQAAKTLTHTLGGYRFVKRIPLASDDDYLLLFTQGNRRVKLAAWTTRPGHDLRLPVAGPCQITGLLGEPSVASAGPILALRLSGSVQYIDPPPGQNAALLRAAQWTATTPAPFYHAGQPIRLALSLNNPDTVSHRARFLIVLSTPVSTQKVPVVDGEDVVAPGTTLRQGAESAALSRVPVRARVALVLDGARQVYPQDVWLIPTDPLTLAAVPAAGAGYRVEVRNPSGTAFSGRVEAIAGGKTRRQPVRLAAGQRVAAVTVPGDPAQATLFALRDRHDALVAYLPAQRFAPYPVEMDGVRAGLEGDPKVASTVHAAPDGAGLAVQYAFAPGWTYWRAGETDPPDVAGRPTGYGVWVNGDGSGNMARMRFRDATGQTFQPDAGPVDWTGWRFVTFPLTLGAGVNIGHWGGDGVIHPPIKIESLFLLDSVGAARKNAGVIALKGPCLIYPARP